MHLGIVTPQLSQYGGAEIYLLECVKRWQEELQITIYTPAYRRVLLKEFGIGAQVQVVRFPAGKRRQELLYNTLVLPRLWEQSLGRHDVYFLYLLPTQFITRRPSVWFAAELFACCTTSGSITTVLIGSMSIFILGCTTTT
jgi:hypothetical protein